MDILLLLLRRELLVSQRRSRFYWKRVLLVAGGSGLFLFSWLKTGNVSTIGLYLIETVASILLWVVCVFAAPAAARAVQRDKESQAIKLLILTDISLLNALLGRFVASFVIFLFMVGAFLPLFALCVGFGGISALQVGYILLLVLCTLFLATAFGTLAGVVTQTRRGRNRILFVGLLAVFGLPHMVVNMFHVGRQMDIFGLNIAATFTPMGALQRALMGQELSPVFFYLGAAAVGGLSALWLAGRLLGRALIVQHAGNYLWQTPFDRKETRGTTRPVAGNPKYWLDYHFRAGGWRRIWGYALGLLAVCIVAPVIVMTFHASRQTALDLALEGTLIGLAIFAYACFAIGFYGPIVFAARSFEREFEVPGFELFLLSDLHAYEILYAKLKAIYMCFLPYLIVCLICCSFMIGSVLLGSGGAEGIIFALVMAAFLAFYVTLLHGACTMAMAYSLRVGRWSVPVMLALVLVYQMLAPMIMLFACVIPPYAAALVLHIIGARGLMKGMVRNFDKLVRRRLTACG